MTTRLKKEARPGMGGRILPNQAREACAAIALASMVRMEATQGRSV